MSDKTKYPARGMMRDGGLIYTHVNGTVHEKRLGFGGYNRGKCAVCKYNRDGSCIAVPPQGCGWRQIEGAYVPSDCELEACDMARKAIVMCSVRDDSECDGCYEFHNKLCHLRKYLAAHGDDQAWEVK